MTSRRGCTEGSTAVGYEHYDCAHLAAPPAEQTHRTTPEAKGDPSLLNPEQLVVMAASVPHSAALVPAPNMPLRVDVVEYQDMG